MRDKPLEKRPLIEIRQAIEQAKAYAEGQGVPLTAERLAAELDMELSMFHRIARGDYPKGGRQTTAKVEAIRRACGEATASVMEHAMKRGSSPNMHMVYLKNNAGYELDKNGKADKEGGERVPPVIFVGEEAISD